jgi:hypothetical protein
MLDRRGLLSDRLHDGGSLLLQFPKAREFGLAILVDRAAKGAPARDPWPENPASPLAVNPGEIRDRLALARRRGEDANKASRAGLFSIIMASGATSAVPLQAG